MTNPSEESEQGNAGAMKWSSILGLLAGWGWAALAGGGGLWLLCTKGPWPLTNGWFALASGISACPLTGWIVKRSIGISISVWVQFGFALFFFVVGRVALMMGI